MKHARFQNWALISFGLFVLALSIFKLIGVKPNTASFSIGTLNVDAGQVFLSSPGEGEKQISPRIVNLQNLMQIETNEIGVGRIHLENGFRAELQPLSIILIQSLKTNSKTVELSILKGQIEIDPDSELNSVQIRKNGESLSAAEYLKSRLKSEPVQSSRNGTGREKGITAEQVSQSFMKMRDGYFHCYTQLLLTQPEAKGTVVFNFSLHPSGQAQLLGLDGSKLKFPTFLNCLTVAFERTTFPEFEGEPISTSIPVEFE